jgi:DNA-binding transcriptional regulator YiaG
LKPIRQWFGLSQGAFAQALGVSRATVAQWEAADTGPHANSAEGRLLVAMMEARDLNKMPEVLRA